MDENMKDRNNASLYNIESKVRQMDEKIDGIKWKQTLIFIMIAILFTASVLKTVGSLIGGITRKLMNNIEKPVIYIYNDEQPLSCTLSITAFNDGHFDMTYPEAKYDKMGDSKYETISWDMDIKADGIYSSGNKYDYLFWDAEDDIDNWTNYTYAYDNDNLPGFCVKGSDTYEFLKDILINQIGFNDRELQDFLTYWVPRMKNNPYNLITFTGSIYDDDHDFFKDNYEWGYKYEITGEDDRCKDIKQNRLMMVYKPLDEYKEVIPQDLTPFDRTGIYMVEWGGTCISE